MLAFFILFMPDLSAHSPGPRGMLLLNWKTPQIEKVYGFYPILSLSNPKPPQTIMVENQECISGARFNINVLDEFAHDIDETVVVKVRFYLGGEETNISFSYDAHGNHDNHQDVTLPVKTKNRKWYDHSFTLSRARWVFKY